MSDNEDVRAAIALQEASYFDELFKGQKPPVSDPVSIANFLEPTPEKPIVDTKVSRVVTDIAEWRFLLNNFASEAASGAYAFEFYMTRMMAYGKALNPQCEDEEINDIARFAWNELKASFNKRLKRYTRKSK